MKQTIKNIKSNFDFTEDLDFVFETTGLGILVEDIGNNIILTNTLFCSLFDINVNFRNLINTSSQKLFSGISNCFKNPDAFLRNISKKIETANAEVDEQFLLLTNRKIIQSYYPLFKNNEQKGHIWIYKPFYEPVNKQLNNDLNFIENALNFLPNEIAIYNSNLQVQFINKAYINSKEKRQWIKNKSLQQFYSYENLPIDTAIQREAYLSDAIKYKRSISWHEKSNFSQYIKRTCCPIISNTQDVEAVIEFSENITQQILLEEKLQQTVNYFYAVLNTTNNIILQTDEKLQVTFLNNYWQKLTGKSNEDSTKKSIFEVLEITHYELYKKAFSILNKSSDQEVGIIAIEDKSKNIKQFSYNLSNGFSVDSNNAGVVATFTDITSEKMQEAQLLELIKKEKELNELKTAFVNMVSHELRTPLTVISSSAEILELMLQKGKGYSDVAIYTQQIIEEVEKMTAFMQDLLMVSKIEAGKININLASEDVVSFVNGVVNKNYSPYKDGRSAVVVVKRKETNANIDASLLEHCLQNILANAFKYSTGNNSPLVRIGFSKTYFTISVSDNGIGIPQHEISKLFTSFFRASNTGNIAGTGIGLVVAKYFTEQHRGYIAVKSKVGKGSIFTIKIPYTKGE